MTRTKSSLTADAQKILGETTSVYYTPTDLDNWFNSGCEDIAIKTQCVKTSTSVTTTSATSYSTSAYISSALLAVDYAEFKFDGSSWDDIDILTPEEMHIEYPGWKDNATGTPSVMWIDEDRSLFGFYPVPNSTNQGAYAKIYFSEKHTSNTVDIPSDLYDALIAYIVWMGLESRGDVRKRGDSWRSKYERGITMYIALKAKPFTWR